jgi:hypothetical protein
MLDFQINYGLIVGRIVSDNTEMEIVHFCGFEKPIPPGADEELRRELATDPTFELVGEIDSLIIVEAPPEVVRFYQEVEKAEEEMPPQYDV